MSATEELKPCPFCGGEAELVKCDYGMYKTGHAVYCIGDCRAKLGVTGRLGEVYEWVPICNTEDEAIDAWNTRAAIEYDGFFYLPKPKEKIVEYGQIRMFGTEHGCKAVQSVSIIENAVKVWGGELGERITERIAEVFKGMCRDKNGFDESIGFECTSCETTVDSYMQTTTSDKPEQFRHCPNCGRKVVDE